jgi:UDP-glucose 4-epimerase
VKETTMEILVTGGAGFIGSNLVRSLVAQGDRVEVFDDLSTGSRGNLSDVDGGAKLTVGDVRDAGAIARAVAGKEVVYHLAALPSVARSVADPATSHAVNVDGTLNVLEAARSSGVRRVVLASSSSVYGDTPTLPKHEEMPVSPRSPYAASKLAAEGYCRSYAHAYGLETVSLRFFNVFGPRQDPQSEYAAAIPRFVTRMLAGRPAVIFGDGRQSRDFTFITNAVQACLLSATAGPQASGEAFNVGCGSRITLLELVAMLGEIIGGAPEPEFAPSRAGDVRDSEAAVSKAVTLLGYQPLVGVREGLVETVRWFARPDAVAV